MIIGRSRFNIYLFLALAIAGVCGCKSPEKERAKRVSTLALHLEVVPDSMDFSKGVSIFRDKPMTVYIDRSPFLTEAQVSDAAVIDELGGWALHIKFDQRGTWLLEQYTTTNPGKHIAVFSTFGEDKKESRWLGAPVITRRISNGILRFTPDATREEADEIVFGLTNLVRQVKEKSRW